MNHPNDPATYEALDSEREDAPTILTEHVYPPIPDRSCDWAAYRDGYDGAPDSHCLVGRGPTEKAAIADLIELEDGRYDAMPDAEREARLADEHIGCYPPEDE